MPLAVRIVGGGFDSGDHLRVGNHLFVGIELYLIEDKVSILVKAVSPNRAITSSGIPAKSFIAYAEPPPKLSSQSFVAFSTFPWYFNPRSPFGRRLLSSATNLAHPHQTKRAIQLSQPSNNSSSNTEREAEGLAITPAPRPNLAPVTIPKRKGTERKGATGEESLVKQKVFRFICCHNTGLVEKTSPYYRTGEKFLSGMMSDYGTNGASHTPAASPTCARPSSDGSSAIRPCDSQAAGS